MTLKAKRARGIVFLLVLFLIPTRADSFVQTRYVPRLRGQPAGQLGQPFYGWLGGATIGRKAVSNGLLQINKRKAVEAASENERQGEPAVKRLA